MGVHRSEQSKRKTDLGSELLTFCYNIEMNRRQALKAGYAMGFMPLVYAAVKAPRHHKKKEEQPQPPEPKCMVVGNDPPEFKEGEGNFTPRRKSLAKNGVFLTGFPSFDLNNEGLPEGSLALILGLSNSGKSAVTRTIAWSNVPVGTPCSFLSDGTGCYDTLSLQYKRDESGELVDIDVKLQSDVALFKEKDNSPVRMASILHTKREECAKKKQAYVLSIPLMRQSVQEKLNEKIMHGVTPSELAATLISSCGFSDSNRIVESVDYIFIVIENECHVVKHRSRSPFSFKISFVGGPGLPLLAIEKITTESSGVCESQNKPS
jgi:hypothetical protein